MIKKCASLDKGLLSSFPNSVREFNIVILSRHLDFVCLLLMPFQYQTNNNYGNSCQVFLPAGGMRSFIKLETLKYIRNFRKRARHIIETQNTNRAF